MAYVQEVDARELPLMRKSFVEVAVAELLDPERTGEPEKFKKNYPHYNFSDDINTVGSTRYDSSFKNHGAEEIEESDNGLMKVCMPCRPKLVIAVPKQKVEECCCCCPCPPEKVVIPPRPYEPVKVVKEVPYCCPIPSIVDGIPHIQEERAKDFEDVKGFECTTCDLTDTELKDAIDNGLDPYDGVVLIGSTKVVPVEDTGYKEETEQSNSNTENTSDSGSEDKEKPTTTATKPKGSKKKEDKGGTGNTGETSADIPKTETPDPILD